MWWFLVGFAQGQNVERVEILAADLERPAIAYREYISMEYDDDEEDYAEPAECRYPGMSEEDKQLGVRLSLWDKAGKNAEWVIYEPVPEGEPCTTQAVAKKALAEAKAAIAGAGLDLKKKPKVVAAKEGEKEGVTVFEFPSGTLWRGPEPDEHAVEYERRSPSEISVSVDVEKWKGTTVSKRYRVVDASELTGWYSYTQSEVGVADGDRVVVVGVSVHGHPRGGRSSWSVVGYRDFTPPLRLEVEVPELPALGEVVFDKVELLGFNEKNGALAWRNTLHHHRFEHVDEGWSAACTYAGMKELPRSGVTLVVKHEQGVEEFPIYEVVSDLDDCTPQAEATVNLERAKARIAELGIDVSSPPKAILPADDQFVVDTPGGGAKTFPRAAVGYPAYAFVVGKHVFFAGEDGYVGERRELE